MTKQKKWNRYQRDVRKFLERFLGYKYPYYLETTGKNHLKVMIKHIGPIVTSGTPSDANAIKNFRAEVKRQIREYEGSLFEEENEVPTIISQMNSKINFDDIILTSIRILKAKIDSMKKHEKTKVLEENTTDGIKIYRNEIIKETVANSLSKNKVNSYIAPSEMKKINKAILEHLTFIMPSMAEYASFLKRPHEPLFILSNENSTHNEQAQEAKINQVKETEQIAEETLTESDNVTFLHQNEKNQIDIAVNATLSKKQKSKSKGVKTSSSVKVTKETDLSLDASKLPESNAALKKEIILNTNSKNRINQLRQLSFFEANALIEDIQQAIELNREEQILNILQLMEQNGISLEDLYSKSLKMQEGG